MKLMQEAYLCRSARRSGAVPWPLRSDRGLGVPFFGPDHGLLMISTMMIFFFPITFKLGLSIHWSRWDVVSAAEQHGLHSDHLEGFFGPGRLRARHLRDPR
jgi:hypothetical protein